jgi:aryl sulfotransferase
VNTQASRPAVSYRGPITDTDRWASFEHRPDDIFVCTPAKCGTTWTQAICAMLVFGTPDHGQQPGVISPWIDADFAPIDEYVQMVNAQTHRRYIKTHTPFDGIPFYPECTYLVVFRDPRDVFFSGSNHRDNMNDQALAQSAFPIGDNAFHDWLNESVVPGRWDRWNLEAIVHFFKSYWHERERDNVHLFHYSDMLRDRRSAVAQMAQAADVALSDAQLDAFAEAASFANMKGRADQFAPASGSGMWKAESQFFATGTSGQWQGRLSEDELAAFDARINELLEPEQASWLLNGNG